MVLIYLGSFLWCCTAYDILYWYKKEKFGFMMASLRRTLSPVPRQGNSVTNEAGLGASPLSKSSSSAQSQNYPSSGGLLSSIFGLSDPQALVLGFSSPRISRPVEGVSSPRISRPIEGVSSPRISRPLERSKQKGQFWRRALLHSLICFVVGIFIGITPFAPGDDSMDPMTNRQAFSSDLISNVGKFQAYDASEAANVASAMENTKNNNVTLKEKVQEEALINGSSFPQDVELESQKLLLIVTPTYDQPSQAYYLNRLAHTLKLVQPPLLWIVVEMTSQSEETADILRRTGVMYRHVVCTKNVTDIKDRRVHQRNAALSHIETHRLDGIVYFADEENVYTTDIFEHMRQIRRFGTWTVAKTGNGGKPVLNGPVCNETQVIGWHTDVIDWRFRRFHAEMSGFAFNSTILWDPKRWNRPTPGPIRQLDSVKNGFQASSFVVQVVEDESQMEGIMQGCSRIMVWNLDISSSISFYPKKWLLKNNLDVMAPLT